MSDIVKGVSNLVASVVEIIKGIITTIIHTFEGAFSAVFSLVRGAFSAFFGLIRSVFNLGEGILGFVIGNFFILGTLAAIYFGYVFLQQRQGRSNPAPLSRGAKKTT